MWETVGDSEKGPGLCGGDNVDMGVGRGPACVVPFFHTARAGWGIGRRLKQRKMEQEAVTGTRTGAKEMELELELTDHEEQGLRGSDETRRDGTPKRQPCLSHPQLEAPVGSNKMFPNVPAYPEHSGMRDVGWDQMSKGRGSFSKRLLAGREATAWELQEAGDPPVDCEVVVNFGTI